MAVLMILVAATAGGCKKKGGGGAWLVGQDGLMVNIDENGELGAGYDTGTDADLNGIGCRGEESGFVVGERGTFLRTYDAATWERVDAGSATLRDIAVAWDLLYVVGDDGLRVTSDDGDHWTMLSDVPLMNVTTTDGGEVALALGADGTLWRWDGDRLTADGALAGATAAALSHEGSFAAAVGAHGAMSVWNGAAWTAVDTGTDADLLAVWAGSDGTAIAVGADGTTVRVSDGTARVTANGAATLRAVRLLGDDGYAAGDGGSVYATHDGGASWERLDLQVPGTVLDLDDIL